jgi:hypothetical protein
MPDAPGLRPATPDELKRALSFALRFDGRKRHRHADDFVAEAAAEKLVDYLAQAGFVVMKKPPAPDYSAP